MVSTPSAPSTAPEAPKDATSKSDVPAEKPKDTPAPNAAYIEAVAKKNEMDDKKPAIPVETAKEAPKDATEAPKEAPKDAPTDTPKDAPKDAQTAPAAKVTVLDRAITGMSKFNINNATTHMATGAVLLQQASLLASGNFQAAAALAQQKSTPAPAPAPAAPASTPAAAAPATPTPATASATPTAPLPASAQPATTVPGTPATILATPAQPPFISAATTLLSLPSMLSSALPNAASVLIPGQAQTLAAQAISAPTNQARLVALAPTSTLASVVASPLATANVQGLATGLASTTLSSGVVAPQNISKLRSLPTQASAPVPQASAPQPSAASTFASAAATSAGPGAIEDFDPDTMVSCC